VGSFDAWAKGWAVEDMLTGSVGPILVTPARLRQFVHLAGPVAGGLARRPPSVPPSFHPRGCDVSLTWHIRWPLRTCSAVASVQPPFHPRGCDVSFTWHTPWPSRMCSLSASVHPRGRDVSFTGNTPCPSRMCFLSASVQPPFHPRCRDVSFTGDTPWPSRMCALAASGRSSVPSVGCLRDQPESLDPESKTEGKI